MIDSIRKSSNDERLNERDREILADDLVRLKDFGIITTTRIKLV